MKSDLSFQILVSTFEGCKGWHFYGWPWTALSLVMPFPIA